MTIFLDIDGVLVPAKSWKSPELMNDGFPAFSNKSISVLKQLIDENTTIMLLTSHKYRFSIEEWKMIFLKRGIQLNNVSRLPENTTFLNRRDEIINWFLNNELQEDFIIIDDDKSLNDLPQFLKEKLVLTSSMIGLSERNLEEIIALQNQKVPLL